MNIRANFCKTILLGTIALTFAISSYAAEARAQPVTERVRPQILSANFGLMTKVESGHPVLTPAIGISNTPGITYGWLIKISPMARQMIWREELIPLQKNINTAAPESATTKAADAGMVTDKGTIAPGDQAVAGAFRVKQGDVSGNYILKIYIDEILVKEFSFALY